MKQRSILALLSACLLAVSLWGCGEKSQTTSAAQSKFDAEKDGILSLILCDNETQEFSYVTLGTKGRQAETEEFESAALTALFVEGNCFTAYTKDGKVHNQVTEEAFFDENSAQVVPDAVALTILEKTAAQHDQPILSLTVITCSGLRFPLVELENTDGSPSVILYYYNEESAAMQELYRGGNIALAGMQLLNPDNLP